MPSREWAITERETKIKLDYRAQRSKIEKEKAYS